MAQKSLSELADEARDLVREVDKLRAQGREDDAKELNKKAMRELNKLRLYFLDRQVL
jgi:hypothetical protein